MGADMGEVMETTIYNGQWCVESEGEPEDDSDSAYSDTRDRRWCIAIDA